MNIETKLNKKTLILTHDTFLDQDVNNFLKIKKKIKMTHDSYNLLSLII